MNILYSGDLGTGSSCLYRKSALERLGHVISIIDPSTYQPKSDILRSIAFRLSLGSHLVAYNNDLLTLAERVRPHLFWADKVLLLLPDTLRQLKEMGIVTVSYMIDNAFGPRKDPGWRLYKKNIPLFDLHVTQRDISIGDYKAHGARNVIKVQTAFEPTVHYACSMQVLDDERNRQVSFIGSPYDNRADTLARLFEKEVPVTVSGNASRWRAALSETIFSRIFKGGELYGDEYREAIWRSKINLSFITHSNQDEYAHKSFEIAGCGGFLLAERSRGHSLTFAEDYEAVFFSDEAELLDKIKLYMPDEEARNRIALAGQRRAVRDGYYNDVQVKKILDRAKEIRSR